MKNGNTVYGIVLEMSKLLSEASKLSAETPNNYKNSILRETLWLNMKIYVNMLIHGRFYTLAAAYKCKKRYDSDEDVVSDIIYHLLRKETYILNHPYTITKIINNKLLDPLKKSAGENTDANTDDILNFVWRYDNDLDDRMIFYDKIIELKHVMLTEEFLTMFVICISGYGIATLLNISNEEAKALINKICLDLGISAINLPYFNEKHMSFPQAISRYKRNAIKKAKKYLEEDKKNR